MRLERRGDGLRIRLQPFQFHKGAIRTSLDMLRAAAEDDFNSIKVRLEQRGVLEARR